jgi:hypothetical protein
MTIDDLQTALEGLSTERLQRLVDRLVQDPDVRVTVGAWRPGCPMVLAGFDPAHAYSNLPEHRFAAVWDRFASSEPRWWIPLPSAGRIATRSDVQLLLRRASAVLAYRATRDHSPHTREASRRRRCRASGGVPHRTGSGGA